VFAVDIMSSVNDEAYDAYTAIKLHDRDLGLWSLNNCRFLVLHTVYSSGLAVLD